MFEQQGIAFAVRQIQIAAQTVGHGVYRPEAGIGEDRTGLETGYVEKRNFFCVATFSLLNFHTSEIAMKHRLMMSLNVQVIPRNRVPGSKRFI